MAGLRVKKPEERKALTAVWAPAGALIKDEFSMQPGALEHAIAVRAMYGREQVHQLDPTLYSQPETSFASIPYLVNAGDPLQFPPIPATSSLLAEPEGQSKEHRVAETLFRPEMLKNHWFYCVFAPKC